MESLTVGVDVVDAADVLDSITSFGARYLDRIFTEHEQLSCAGEPQTRALGLAARFAAKEATIKALRPQSLVPTWKSIEIWRTESGWCEVRLSGNAEVLARERQISSLSLSFSHEKNTATAVVIAVKGRETPC